MSKARRSSLRGRAILGDFFHAPTVGTLAVLFDTLIILDDEGRIIDVLGPDAPERSMAEAAMGERILRLPRGTYGLPGFVDLHVHAPQYPQLGLALDKPLEVWLNAYTFPLEAQYADLDLAEKRYRVLVEDLLANGTTTALYFATQHVEASALLADLCLELGQRALVGKVAMDDPASCPDYYRDADAETAIEGTRAVIDHIRSHPDNGEGRVLPVVTPRFTPSCSEAALEGLGALAREYGCHIQTHCSESDWAHGHALSRFGKTDAEALDGFGLLTRHTVLAHANFLDNTDMDRVSSRGSGVAHCALSNIYFANSVFPLREALERQVRVGLGTDISGGPSRSMFDACLTTVRSSRMLEEGVDPALPKDRRGRPNSAVDLVTAFHLATAGGADVLDLPVGRLEKGCRFDVVLIDASARAGGIRLFETVAPEAIFEKIIHGATRANISSVFVDGYEVAGTAAIADGPTR
ncbi:chlorohydrolase [Devosia soli]|uniref:Guanine deaminase n=1 Tax=Devosia soli TaxID=361041 RepID=A0A0F5L9E0_9HYPH|nr:guanine deaminase [Devosia soli]KKB78227.1 chlorohydrolase [Devosia soli]